MKYIDIIKELESNEEYKELLLRYTNLRIILILIYELIDKDLSARLDKIMEDKVKSIKNEIVELLSDA